jgi:hypothetical protein
MMMILMNIKMHAQPLTLHQLNLSMQMSLASVVASSSKLIKLLIEHVLYVDFVEYF